MSDIKPDPRAAKAYTEAHSAHYTEKNLKDACRRYGSLIAEYPDSKEAQYSRSQIDNIAKSAVPASLILDELMAMIEKHLPAVDVPDVIAERNDSLDGGR